MSNQQNLPPNYFYHRMSNGIELIGQYMPGLRSITFGFQFNAAVIHEPEGKQGLAHLFEYMLFQGTKEKDARTLNETFESIGARKGASTGLETAQIWVQVVNTKFNATLQIINELLLMPTFPMDKLEQMRRLVLQEVRSRADESMNCVFDLLRANFYRGTKLARPLLGSEEFISTLQQQDLQGFWKAHYQPDQALFAIAGNFDWDNVVSQMEALFGRWQGYAQPSPELLLLEPSPGIFLEHQEGKQEHLALMFPFTNYSDPDYYAALVVSEILGGSMASRLFVEVREKRGLVYSIISGLGSNRYSGAMRIYASTAAEQSHECLKVIIGELCKLEQHGITSNELHRSKVRLKSENVKRGEQSGSCMGAIARSWWYENKFRPIQEVKEAIDAVTEEQVLNVLHHFPPLKTLTIAAIGSLSQDELVGDILQ